MKKKNELCLVCGAMTAELVKGPRKLLVKRGVHVTLDDDEFFQCCQCGETYQPIELARKTEARLAAIRQEMADLLAPVS